MTEKNKEYFRNLAHLVHLKVINLGETPLGTIGEDWLENLYKEKFSDYDELECGFCFDGQFARACRTPLGNMHTDKVSGKFELIGTPKELLLRFQSEECRTQDRLLVVEMANADFVTGTRETFDKYKSGLQKSAIVRLRKSIGKELLEVNSKEFKLELSGCHEGKLYEVKREIYRFPDRMIENLALISGCKALGAWDRIDEMSRVGENQLLNSNAANNLKIAIEISMEIRLRVYIHYNRRAEKAAIIVPKHVEITKEDIQKRDVFHLSNKQMLLRFYYTALPFMDAIESLNIDPMKKKSLFDDSSWTRSRILARLLKYNDAIQVLEPILELNLREIMTHRLFVDRIDGERIFDLRKMVVSFCNWCMALSDYKKAQSIMDKFLDLEQSVVSILIPKDEIQKIVRHNEAVLRHTSGNICVGLGLNDLAVI